MDLKVNDKIHGFTVTRIRPVEEFEGELIEMTHDRTGAGLIWAKSSEENKLFSVGFRTLPEDNTGVFHILEHSVLCGSDRYPVKEPFVELLKTSMNTFLNAMTYSDKTLYPVSSRMEQDYLNLMGVYLDAVFRPSILTNPNIFYQEGWHIDTEGESPVFKGVVFNEMKGAMSDVDQVAERTLGKLLFPDTCYGYNSGGDPDAIPDLTYEDFIARYRRFYHPSNAYFYLDGDIPLDKTLEMIESYLADYDRLDNVPEIVMQVPVRKEDVVRFDASDEDEKPMLVFGRIAGTWEDRDKLLALSVLNEQLADSNESPLKRAVLSSGLAEDMELYISDGIAQPYMVMLFRGISPAALDNDDSSASAEDRTNAVGSRLLEIVRETVTEVLEAGIPERDLTAIVNQTDFRFRQYPEPQGLYRANSVFGSWLYGGDPALYLRSNEAISNLRKALTPDNLRALAQEYLLDTDSLTRLTLIPSTSVGEEVRAAEEKRVSDTVAAMSDEEKAALDELNSGLRSWQETPDSEEALATIPQLALSDIKREPELIGTEVSTVDGVTLLYHHVPTKGIIYINAYFPLTDLPYEDLAPAALITEFYKDLPTENYSITELQNEIKMYVGSLTFGIDVLARDGDTSACTPCIRARASVLKENLSHAEDLIIEVLTRTKFDDKELMRELIAQIDDEGRRYAVSSGHRLALYAARSGFSSRDAASEALNGYTFIQYVHGLYKEFDKRMKGFGEFAHEVISGSIVKSGAYISVTASEPADMSRLAGMLSEGSPRPASVSYDSPLPARFGIQVPASVSHAVAVYDLAKMDLRPHGSLSVASNILSLAYLWNEIRVKGGAYGTAVSSNRTGSFVSYSYRDPSPARSLEIYKTMPEFLDSFAQAPEGSIDGFIISTIAQTEPLVSPASKGRSADDFWFSGFTDEDRIRVRREILETTPQRLADWHDAFEKLASEGRVCVVGPASALETCEGLETVSI